MLLAEPADVAAAVTAAAKAFDSWSESSLSTRMRVMFAFRELLVRHEDELARIISAEHGKVLDDARGEVVRGREVVEFACGIADALKGDYSAQYSRTATAPPCSPATAARRGGSSAGCRSG
ncbi:aldehyde dehydrogenase family protein [Streptomyces sp. P5_D11]